MLGHQFNQRAADHHAIGDLGNRAGLFRRAHAEADCDRFAKAMNYPIIPCDLCGSQDGLQRQQVKQILDGWETRSPGRRQVMFRALMNARPSHLPDPGLFDFAGLMRTAPGPSEIKENPPQLRGED